MREIAKLCQKEIYPEISFDFVLKWLKSYRHHSDFYVAIEDNKIVGFICWSLFGRHQDQVLLEISFLAVRDIYQGQGIGRKLLLESLEMVKKKWKKQGCKVTAIMAETDEDNETASHFYRQVLSPSKEIRIPRIWHLKNKKIGKIFFFKKL